MAVPPERRDLNEQAEIDRRPYAAGGWFAWWWVWFIIIIGFIWFAGWGWGGYGGWWWGRPRVEAVQPLTTGSGVAVLTSSNKQSFVGQPFEIRDVLVRNKVNNQVLWIAANNTAPMLVVLPANGNGGANPSESANATPSDSISQGNRIDVTGTVQKSPPADQVKQQWNLSDRDAQRLEQQGAYVQGTIVQQTASR